MRQVSTPAAPVRLVVTIGGFGGPHHEVRWQRGKLWYRTDESTVPVVPSADEWERFWTAIDHIGVWSWEARYDDLDVCDGTQWEIDIRQGSRRVRCFGSNAYPEPFQEFLAAVKALVRQPIGT